MARPMWFPAAVALCVLWVAGCSAVEEENPWADTIREWESRASSDFEREVLSDGEITEAEYREAVDRMITCARDQGVEVSVTESGYFYESDMVSSEHTSQIVD
ncbi:MAG TPA: hypothetical protein GX743_05895, partial [Actinomycetales bacterium]|nr:hypothetical protein [Actinomycetales bacterium]